MRHADIPTIAGAALATATTVALAGTASAQGQSPTATASLEDRVEALESFEGFRLPGGATAQFYGYVKGDVIFDDDFDLGNTIFDLGTIGRADGPEQDDASRAHAFQTRLGLDVTRPTDQGDIALKIEGDFFGDGGGQLRLRHAYGEFQGLLVGQTWTNFMPIESYPATIDFQGPAGLPFVRQGQVRYTYQTEQGFGFSASVEDDPGDSDRVGVTAALFYEQERYFFKVAGLSRELNDGMGGTEDGWGVNVSGNAQLWDGGSINASYTTGEGIGSYMVFGGMAGGINGNGDIDAAGDAIETEAWQIGISQSVQDFTLGLQYGYREVESFFGADSNDTEELQTVHATVIYRWADNVNVGLEYIYGERSEFDNDAFENDRIQFAVQYTF